MLNLNNPIFQGDRSKKYWDPEYWVENQRWLYWLEAVVRALNRKDARIEIDAYWKVNIHWSKSMPDRSNIVAIEIYPPATGYYISRNIIPAIIDITTACENIAKWYGGDISDNILDDFLATRFWGSKQMNFNTIKFGSAGVGWSAPSPYITIGPSIIAPYIPIVP